MKYLLAIILSFLLMSMIAGATDVYPSGSADQNAINTALESKGDVYLHSGVYDITNPIYIYSETKLHGDSGTILRVNPNSGQWYTDGTGIINHKETLKNVEICGFQIDGNLENLPQSYASSGKGEHNCERGIYLRGNKKAYMENISIHDMTIYNTFSDGCQIAYANNVICYNNLISNCQHESIFLICVVCGITEYNQLAGITSDCLRLDNCVDNIIRYNYFYSYTGSDTNGQSTGGHQGIQIADEGYSKGGGSAKPEHTTNIEVYGNTFSGDKRMNVWLDSTKKGVDNVYVHDNTFLDGNSLVTTGTPVDASKILISEDGITIRNMNGVPTIDQAREIFSIFDLFNRNYYSQAGENDTIVLPDNTTHIPAKVTGTIEYVKTGESYRTFVELPLDGLSEVRYEVNGTMGAHTLMIGERTNKGVEFTKTSIWEGNLSHTDDAIKIDGKVLPSEIKVTCTTPKSTLTPTFLIKETEVQAVKINPLIFILFGVLILVFFTLRTIVKNSLFL